MSEGVERQQQRISEFLRLMPLTLEIAGLARSEANRNFSESQMEARVATIRTAYKIARQLVMEMAK